MELNELDRSIKENLEKRSISPSADAWNSLSNRLDADTEKKKNHRTYWMLGLAASLVGVLLVVTQWGGGEDIMKDEPFKVVVVPNVTETEAVKPIQQNVSKEKDKSVQQDLVKAEQEPKNKTVIKEIISAKNSQKIALEKNQTEAPAKTQENLSIQAPAPDKNLTFEQQKIQDVVAEVHALKDKNIEVTEADIDALLFKAQNEIAHKRLYQESTGKVDANALLQSVEQELDQSFRSKVLEALKASYNSVKTSIAQRNK
ncbi:hypothetical protein [Algibacter mikhailovii]|uniref:Uncharacterized protein n=1 Tax=Algibacter mikhailovii TaxID=425498 RepID=A0A918V7J6_9FLAO|nr:hypothetical protein [Algibacter mikhailovii]GGZ72958.1 hypothetical protein GCM10007028_07520 [Algibacter mikhailovii]